MVIHRLPCISYNVFFAGQLNVLASLSLFCLFFFTGQLNVLAYLIFFTGQLNVLAYLIFYWPTQRVGLLQCSQMNLIGSC